MSASLPSYLELVRCRFRCESHSLTTEPTHRSKCFCRAASAIIPISTLLESMQPTSERCFAARIMPYNQTGHCSILSQFISNAVHSFRFRNRMHHHMTQLHTALLVVPGCTYPSATTAVPHRWWSRVRTSRVRMASFKRTTPTPRLGLNSVPAA